MEGSKIITIPSQTYRSCKGCDFYQKSTLQSGLNPIYRHDCRHVAKEQLLMFGNLASDKTPSSCPLLKQNIEAEKLRNQTDDREL
jgi:hypothetical protein